MATGNLVIVKSVITAQAKMILAAFVVAPNHIFLDTAGTKNAVALHTHFAEVGREVSTATVTVHKGKSENKSSSPKQSKQK